MISDEGGERPLAVWRCAVCGDTYPAPEASAPACPSCGASAAEIAHEPLL